MFRTFLSTCFLTFVLVSTGAFANFKEGVHYEELDIPETDRPEIVEYFSYYCPACRGMEAYLPVIKGALPESVAFKKVHADIMRNASTDVQYWFAVGYEFASAKKWEQPYSDTIFRMIHDQRQVFLGKASVVDIFKGFGLSDEDIEDGLNSFAIKSRANRHKLKTTNLREAGGLKGVPTFVINGKYVVDNRKLDPTNFAEELAELVVYLSNK